MKTRRNVHKFILWLAVDHWLEEDFGLFLLLYIFVFMKTCIIVTWDYWIYGFAVGWFHPFAKIATEKSVVRKVHSDCFSCLMYVCRIWNGIYLECTWERLFRIKINKRNSFSLCLQLSRYFPLCCVYQLKLCRFFVCLIP